MHKIPLFQVFKHDTWVKPFFTKYKRTLFLALFLGFLTFFSAAALMFTSGYLISRAASLPENILMIYIPIVLTRGFGIGRPVFRYVERLVSHNWVLKMTSRLRLKLYETLEKDAVFFKRNYRIGDILGILSEDINYIQNLYLRTIFPTAIAWIVYLFVLLGLGMLSVSFALLIGVLLFSIVAVLPFWSVIINGARQEQEKQQKNALYAHLTDNVLGVSDWIFSQRGSEYVALHEHSQKDLLNVQAKMRRFNRRRNFLLQVIFGGIVVAFILWTSQKFSGNHGGSANWIAAFVLSIFPLIDAFAVLPDASQETNTYKDSITRLNDLPERTEKETYSGALADLTIDINEVSFQYDDDTKQILNRFSLVVPPGEKLAILGRSGAGKSTLASLIRGDLKPTEGSITLGGVDTDVLGDVISDSIGVIQQTPYLFNTTIANNLRIGKQQATDEEIWQVLTRVGLRELVEKLPLGLNTMVDEAGLRFSGGERHRMALARVLLKDPPIVLLDEPTVGLDPITEQALIDTFFGQLNTKTVIWITHHLQGIEKMKRVIFIENGQLAMSGTPTELAESNERYRQLKAIDDGQ